ncbi:hypothetical protein ABEG17_02565 [Pedococcus sp. KACC 23699]|uniref:Uncharacterized protein n=1 Tax=Pedococcus sp. KACC 23699 TaxID=3149228 RepID=A0AAU7JVC3_9MICO
MFNESWPWKRDLAAAADRLEEARLGLAHRLEFGDGDDAYEQETEAVYQVERDVMSGAFAARRLIGMPSKVTKRARATKAVVTRFPLRGDVSAPDTWDALDDLEMYDMDARRDVSISANEMCNLFVHSLIFRLAWTLEGLSWANYWALPADDPRCEAMPTEVSGLLVATDKSSSQHLTLVSVVELVRVFRILANDEVSQVISRRDHQGRVHVTAE